MSDVEGGDKEEFNFNNVERSSPQHGERNNRQNNNRYQSQSRSSPLQVIDSIENTLIEKVDIEHPRQFGRYVSQVARAIS